MEFVPLEIVGVVASKVGEPSHQGTAGGGGLYSVPIQLSRSIDYEEVALLTELWERAAATSNHRPGTVRVYGDSFMLTTTTIDEVASHHARTLRLVVDAFNEEMPRQRAAQIADEARERVAAEEHRKHVDAVAAKLRFD